VGVCGVFLCDVWGDIFACGGGECDDRCIAAPASFGVDGDIVVFPAGEQEGCGSQSMNEQKESMA
jgi:hypothetical protein